MISSRPLICGGHKFGSEGGLAGGGGGAKFGSEGGLTNQRL